MRLVFDLDGVLRDLNGYLAKKYGIPMPQDWFWEHRGLDIFGWVRYDGYEILKTCPQTEYLSSFKKEITEIWTCQPNDWVYPTLEWINFYLPFAQVRILTTKEKERFLYESDDILLVEDSPHFKNYDRAIIVTGDGDFHCLVEYLEEKDKLLKVLAPNKHFSSLLRKYSYYITRVDILKHSLEQKKDWHSRSVETLG